MDKEKAKIPAWIIWAFIFIALVGFVDSLHLSVSFLQNSTLNCSFLDGCDVVTTSEYSIIGGIPISFIGLGYYLIVMFLALTYFSTKNELFLKYDIPLTGIGFIVSLILIYLQVFVIEALCLYCMISAVASILLFIFAIIIMRYLNKTN